MIDTGKAKLPGLPAVSTGNASLDRWIQAVSERLEVREGTRGNKFEQVVTWRDLQKLGISDLSFTGGNGGMGMGNGGGDGVLVQQPNGSYNVLSIDEFGDKIRKTKLYADLQKRLDDPSRFDDFPEAVRAILKVSIADEAAKRGADIQRLDYKLQSEVESLAYTVQEVTASVAGAHAGIRELSFASATPDAAMAGRVTTIEARLNEVDVDPLDTLGVGDVVDGTPYADLTALSAALAVGARRKGRYYKVGTTPTVLYIWNGTTWVEAGAGLKAMLEETMIASVDRIRGASAEYMVKVNAGAAVAGFGLAATEDPTGATSSTFLVQADQFALTTPYTFVQETTPSALATGNTWYKPSTRVSYYATAPGTGSWSVFTPPIPFGVDTTTGTTYINGTLRVGSSAGPAISSITSGQGQVKGTSFLRAVTAPATPTGGSFASPTATSGAWSDGIPVDNNEPLWMTTRLFTSDGLSPQQSVWTTPQKIGTPSTGSAVQFSIDGSTLWHYTPATNDYYMRSGTSTDNGVTWTWAGAVKIKGETGVAGDDGDSVDIVFVRSATQPATPTASAGVPTAPITWYSAVSSVPASANPMWSSTGVKPLSLGNYTWDTPVKIDGTAVAEVIAYIRSASAPSTPTTGGTYTFSATPVYVAPNAPATWSTAIPAGTNPIYTSRAVVSAPSGYTSAVSITGWTTPVLSFQNGVDGLAGARGTLTGSRAAVGAAWSDTVANAVIQDLVNGVAPGTTASTATTTLNKLGDTVSQSFSSSPFAATKYWSAVSTWVTATSVIDGNQIVTGTVNSAALDTYAVTAKTIRSGSNTTTAAHYTLDTASFLGYSYAGTLVERARIDWTTGYAHFKNIGSTFAVHGETDTGTAVYGYASSTGVGLKGTSTSGTACELTGNGTRAPLALGATLTANPSSATVGDVYVNNHATAVNKGLFVYVNGVWHNHTRGLQTKTSSNVISFDWVSPNLLIYIDTSLIGTFNSGTKVWS